MNNNNQTTQFNEKIPCVALNKSQRAEAEIVPRVDSARAVFTHRPRETLRPEARVRGAAVGLCFCSAVRGRLGVCSGSRRKGRLRPARASTGAAGICSPPATALGHRNSWRPHVVATETGCCWVNLPYVGILVCKISINQGQTICLRKCVLPVEILEPKSINFLLTEASFSSS